MKFTFDVSKCDRIFDELLRLGHLKITHVIPPSEEVKRRAYCKFIILHLTLLMIVMCFVDRYNQP